MAESKAVVPNPYVGRMAVLAAALLWSTSGLFAKAPLFTDWSLEYRGLLLAFWRAAFAALALAPLIRRPRWRPGLIPLGAAFTGMNVTYLTAMTLTTAANAIWLQSTAPWWVFLIGVCWLREPMLRRDLIPLVFGFVGVGLIIGFEAQGQSGVGVAMGIAAGVCFGVVVVCLRRLRDENSAWLIALNHAAVAAALLPWVVYLGVWPSPAQLLALAGFGIVQMAVPYILLMRGLRAIGSQEAVAIGLVEPVLMPLWVYLAWGETPAWWTLLGASWILIGLLLRYLVFTGDPTSTALPQTIPVVHDKPR